MSTEDEINRISSDILRELIWEEKRRDNYLYQVTPTKKRVRRPEAYIGHPNHSAEIWMEEVNADNASRIAHFTEFDNHINRVRGRNC